MEEGASPPRWALDKKLGEDASLDEKKEGEKERGGSTKLKEEKGKEVDGGDGRQGAIGGTNNGDAGRRRKRNNNVYGEGEGEERETFFATLFEMLGAQEIVSGAPNKIHFTCHL